MIGPARFSGRARHEIATALREMDRADAAEEMRDALEAAARRLGRNPMLGSPLPYIPARYRFWLLPRFGYALVYDPQTEPVEILRFVHTRRDLPRLLTDLAGDQGG